MKIQLTQQIIIHNKHRYFSMLDELCFKSKNLYNYALYQIRQYYKQTSKYLSYYELNSILSKENQIDTLTNFAISNGYIVDKVYKDIASGLSFDRMEFKSMLIDMINHKIKTVIIANKDRFSRISFKMWKELFEYFNCNIIIANEANNTNEETKFVVFRFDHDGIDKREIIKKEKTVVDKL